MNSTIEKLLDECNTFKVYQHKNYCKIDEKLFHYTNIFALKAILENKKIWLTKADYMNDSQEVVYATDKISRICMNKFDYKGKCYNQVIDSILVPNQFNKRAFILSFSRDNDSLSLWSNYSNMEGYNIGFGSIGLYNAIQKSIENMLESISIDKRKVVYGKDYNIIIDDIIYDKQLQEDIVMEINNKMELVMSFYRKTDINAYQTNKLLKSLAKRLQGYIGLFKQETFNVEKETRMIITIEDNGILDKMIKHRISNGALVPYIEVDFNTIDDSIPFQGISIGPRNNSDLAKKGMSSFLNLNGFNISDEAINKSSIPLRF